MQAALPRHAAAHLCSAAHPMGAVGAGQAGSTRLPAPCRAAGSGVLNALVTGENKTC